MRKIIEREMAEIRRVDGPIQRFYMRWKPTDNITANDRDGIGKLRELLDKVFGASTCKAGIPAIEMLVLYTHNCVHVLAADPLWDPLEYPKKEDFFHYINVPLTLAFDPHRVVSLGNLIEPTRPDFGGECKINDHPYDCDGLCYDCEDGDWCESSKKKEH